MLNETEDASEERTNFENAYYRKLARTHALIKAAEPDPLHSNTTNDASQQSQPGGSQDATIDIQNQFDMLDIMNRIKLPTFELPLLLRGLMAGV